MAARTLKIGEQLPIPFNFSLLPNCYQEPPLLTTPLSAVNRSHPR